jgi:hypothetical protein
MRLCKGPFICPNCGLDHAVFGLAVWCSDCGQDIFLTHVNAELNVVKTMLSDVGRRRNDLGPRVAARDIENCLEDVVSIYEAVFRALFSRCLRARGITDDELQSILAKKIANKFQNVRFSGEIVERELGLNPFEGIGEQPLQELIHTFEKRHPITHNLGVVDRKYLERMRFAEREGREVMVSPSEITKAIETSLEVIGNLHRGLFGVKQTFGWRVMCCIPRKSLSRCAGTTRDEREGARCRDAVRKRTRWNRRDEISRQTSA